MKISDQVLNAAKLFARQELYVMVREGRIRSEQLEGASKSLVAAFISGASLTAHFIVANDGNPMTTPQNVEHGVEEAAVEFGLRKSTLGE
jgi:hypothetical protein